MDPMTQHQERNMTELVENQPLRALYIRVSTEAQAEAYIKDRLNITGG